MKTCNGFTLVELMISMVVLAVGILGFMFLQARSIEGRVFSREMNRAVSLAQQQMDILLETDFDNPLLDSGSHPTSTEDTIDGTNDGQLTINFQNFLYAITWTINDSMDLDSDGFPDADFKGITVVCQWTVKNTDANPPARTLTYTLESVKRN